MRREKGIRVVETNSSQWNKYRGKCKEASLAQSKADFEAKLSIALKEAGETEYWLELLHESDYIDTPSFESIYSDNKELIKLLTSILKTSRSK